MNTIRRNMLKGAVELGALSVAAVAGLLKPARALAAWNEAGFNATSLNAALSAIGAGSAVASRDIMVKAPDIAENGAAVPVEVVANLPDVESIAIFGEKNAYPLVGQYKFTDFDGFLSTRIKMGATSNVRVVVRAGGKLYSASKEVKVTVGGCG
jgi:sulfur-oxidizing protein SoxY